MPQQRTIPLRIFIGSSTERKSVAQTLYSLLEPDVETIGWWDAFPAGQTPHDSLAQLAANIDFAVFIMAPDDVAQIRSCQGPIVRDNVLFELGLFTGSVGKTRSIMLIDPEDMPHIPPDLKAVTWIPWRQGDPHSLQRAASKILKTMDDLYDRLGLGWWIIEIENTATIPNRIFYGIFELTTSRAGIRVRYGKTFYGRSFEKDDRNRHREDFTSTFASYNTGVDMESHLIFLAEVVPVRGDRERDPEVHALGRHKTLFEAYRGDPEWFSGWYFDIETENAWRGNIRCRRLGVCTQSAAKKTAKEAFMQADTIDP